jgi:hypothetical protein
LDNVTVANLPENSEWNTVVSASGVEKAYPLKRSTLDRALARAAANSSGERLCEWLLNLGAKVDGVSGEKPPLICAAGAGHLSICKLLLIRGANSEARWENSTAVMAATQQAKEDVVKFLFELGAHLGDVNIMLLRGIRNNKQFLCQLALDEGASLNRRIAYNFGSKQVTLLFIAAYQNKKSRKTFETLITRSFFNPISTKAQREEAMNRLFTVLLIFHRIWPTLPKDLLDNILKINHELRADTYLCVWNIHIQHEERAPNMPIPVVRQLLKRGFFKPEATVAHMKRHHQTCLKSLMDETLSDINTLEPERLAEAKMLLDADTLGERFDNDIAANISRILSTGK